MAYDPVFFFQAKIFFHFYSSTLVHCEMVLDCTDMYNHNYNNYVLISCERRPSHMYADLRAVSCLSCSCQLACAWQRVIMNMNRD